MSELKLKPKPSWLKVKLPVGEKYRWLSDQSRNLKLATVCEEARCPNIGECWSSGTATFMVMGDICTRGCSFCAVKTNKSPPPLDIDEPQKLAETLSKLNLSYVVLTSVDRDDLTDQGAGHIRKCIEAIKQKNPQLLVEMLMPDFRGEEHLISEVCLSEPAVVAHNIETVPRLTKLVRDRRAGYKQSLTVLDYAKSKYPALYTKSSIMVGLGETETEVIDSLKDLRQVGVDFVTIGQYLQPRRGLLGVREYIHPDQFKHYEQQAMELGFLYAASGPLVRSSYKAGEFFISSIIKNTIKY